MNAANRFLSGLVAVALVIGPMPVYAQDAPPAPTPEQIDAAIDQLVQVDPATLVGRFGELKGSADAQAAEAAALRAQAEKLDADATVLGTKVDALLAHAKAVSTAFLKMAEQPSEAPAEMAAAPPAEPMMEQAAAAAFTNFSDHVKPIFAARCERCHNADNRKSGLSLATHAALLEGGSSGPVVTAGNPDGSRLLKLIMHTEEPVMPPSGEPLKPEEIETIRKWIADGALADANSTPMATAKEEAPVEEGGIYVAATFVDGPPPMPEVELPQPEVLASSRGVVARAVATSMRAPLMAVGSNHQVLLYNLENYELLGALPFPEGDIFTLEFSINGEVLVVGGGEEGANGICVVYHVRTGERMGTYGEAYDTVLAADISPDHRMIAVGGPNRKVRVYSVDTAQELYVIEPHTDWILAVKFTPDGEVLSTADRAGNLYLWQAANGRAVEQLRGHEGAIYSLDYSYDSTYLLSAGQDGKVFMWDTWKYTQVRNWQAHGAPVLELDVSQDGRVLTASNDKTVKMWNLEGAEQKAYAGLPDWGYQAAFGLEGKTVLAGAWTGEVYVWNSETAEVAATVQTNPQPAAAEDPFAVAKK